MSKARVIIPQTNLPENFTAIVTGGHAGLGYEVAKYLALLGARVIIACDNEIRGRAALLRIQADVMEIRGAVMSLDEGSDSKDMSSDIGPPPADNLSVIDEPVLLEFIKLNPDSLQSVTQFVKEFRSREYPLHLLICSEAIINAPQAYTEDNYERHFQHNYLTNFLLTLLLLPELKHHREDSRVIFVGSTNHTSGEFNLKNMQGKAGYNKSKFYANSELYLLMFMNSLHRRLEGSNVSVFAVHNGTVDTLLKQEDDPGTWGAVYSVGRTLGKILKNTSKSVNNCLSVAISPALRELRGHFFAGGFPITPSPLAKDSKAQEVLWRYSIDCIKDHITHDQVADLKLSEETLAELGINC